MDNMEEKLGSILNNPEMMQQIMAMAQSLGQNHAPSQPESTPILNFDPAILQKLSVFAQQSSVNGEEQALLNALHPYLSRNRIGKLERAMRAAKMARFASSFLNAGGLQLLTGR